MDRQLKFRVWDKLAKRYLKITPFSRHHYVLDLNGNFLNLQNGSGGDEYVVEQFTGLTDKNGKDIYEGDIINSYFIPNRFQVVYTSSGFGTILPEYTTTDFDWNKHTHSEEFKNLTFYCNSNYHCEIIGNINENPELLNNMN